jgi:hypothetical protein
MDAITPRVNLACVKEGGRLRVKITSPGYNPCANCQFPQNLRKDGATYSVPPGCIRFARGSAGTFFYRITKKSEIRIEGEKSVAVPSKIYGIDDEDTLCQVCFENERSEIFIPCGHFCCCASCYKNLPAPSCPMCRATIQDSIDKSKI